MTFTCALRQARLRIHRLAVLILAVAISVSPLAAQTYTVRTYAGPSEPRGGSTDGSAVVARFRGPAGVAVDHLGNIFIADARNHTVRRADPEGNVATLAGLAGHAGDADGRGAAARFNELSGIALDSHGNVYVSDVADHTIRRIRPDGTVTTLAGLAGAPGNVDGSGSNARFDAPRGLAVDLDGNVFVADSENHVIRRIAPDGAVTTLAGLVDTPGFSDGEGAAARFVRPLGMAIDGDGDLYVSEAAGIRHLTRAGVVTTVFGSSTTTRDDLGNPAVLVMPTGIAVDDSGVIFVSDATRDIVRRVNRDGTVTAIAGHVGSQFPEYSDGHGVAARFDRPAGIGIDPDGRLVVADEGHNLVRRITRDGYVSTILGAVGRSGGVDGPGPIARFDYPAGIVFDRQGNLYLADIGDRTIRKISPERVVTTVAGKLRSRGIEDGAPHEARFMTPTDVAIDLVGNILVADAGAETIRRISPSAVRTIAGAAEVSGAADGKATAARFNHPRGVAVDASGNIIVADSLNHTIRRISGGSLVSTIAGRAGWGGTWDGYRTNARFRQPEDVAFGADGTLYIADTYNHAIRKMSSSGAVTTLAGRAGVIGRIDGVGAEARFWHPSAIAVDRMGTVYVGDDDRVRKVDPSGAVTTIAILETVREGSFIYGGDANGIAVDRSGNVYVADGGHGTVLVLSPTLSDHAGIDRETGAVGVTRQLTASAGDADSWEWSITRRPSGSVAQLSDAHARNPTFTPDVADRYEFRLIASNRGAASVTDVPLTVTAGMRSRPVRH